MDICQYVGDTGVVTTVAERTQLPLVECCSPLTGTVLSAGDAAGIAAVLKALADPARLRLVSLIAAHEGGEACACELNEPVGLSQPTVSHHLKVLTDAGIVTREQRGKWAYFRIVPGALEALGDLFGRR